MTLPYIAATRPHADATALLATFGAGAAEEAVARAERCRRVGNHLTYCHWRTVGRLIRALDAGRNGETVH